MPKAGRNIYKRKDGRWEGRYIKGRSDGKTRYGSVYAHSLAEVKSKLEIMKSRQAEKKNRNQTETATMESVSRDWLESMAVSHKDATIIKYEDLLRCYILPTFGDVQMDEISNEQLMKFSTTLLTEGGERRKGLSGATVQEVMSVLNSIRIYALRQNQSVSYNVECVCIRKNQEDILCLSVNEEQTLIDWLIGNMNPTNLGILLCLFTGLRLGEICALKWDDIDFAQGTISVTKTMHRLRTKNNPDRKTEVRIDAPKSARSIRTIPIPENLKTILTENYRKNAYILTGQEKKYVEPRTMENRFKKVLKDAGISEANYHAIRHSFTTRCVDQGVDIKCLSEILGHASVSITLNRYVHPSMELKTQNLAKLTGAFPLISGTDN